MKKYVRIIDNKVQAIFEYEQENTVLMEVPTTFQVDDISEYIIEGNTLIKV